MKRSRFSERIIVIPKGGKTADGAGAAKHGITSSLLVEVLGIEAHEIAVQIQRRILFQPEHRVGARARAQVLMSVVGYAQHLDRTVTVFLGSTVENTISSSAEPRGASK